MVGDSGAGDALATPEGALLATEIVERLEAELVRFTHRVAHGHGIELDRARAALVLLSKLVSAGVPWTARPDSAPTLIHDAFTRIAAQHPKTSPLATTMRREIAAFFVATANVVVEEFPAMTPAVCLRLAGAEPALWTWAIDHEQADTCWSDCGDDAGALVQIALAFGVPVEQVARGFAGSLAVVLGRIKTRRTVQRQQLAPLLVQIGETGADAIGDRALVAAITKLAFEVTAGRQLYSQGTPKPADLLDDLAITAFQLVEILRTSTAEARPDLERFATLARGCERAFTACGLVQAALLRRALQDALAHALEA